MPGKTHVQTIINGEHVDFLCEPRQSLLEVLRDEIGLTGTKEGCNDGNCGACSIAVDGVLVDSCLMLAVEADVLENTRHGPSGYLRQCWQTKLDAIALGWAGGRGVARLSELQFGWIWGMEVGDCSRRVVKG